MFKTISKFMFMVKVGLKYVKIFKQTFFHPYITKKSSTTQLSQDRQSYSNKILEYLNIEVEVIGEIPSRDRILYAINHRSLLDIIVMEHIFSNSNKNGTWIAKQELFESFIYGDFFKYSGCIGVDLESKRGLLSFFKEIKSVFSKVDNFNIYMFPEGERYKEEGIGEFQSGASKIAKSNKLEVIPVFINDSLEKVFEDAPYKEKRKVQVHIGEVISHKNLENEYIEFMNQAKGKSIE